MVGNSVWRRARALLGRSARIRRAAGKARSARLTLAAHRPTRRYSKLPPAQALRTAYNVVLTREPDPVGAADYLPRLVSGQLSRDELVEWLLGSEEFVVGRRSTLLGPSIHASRCQFIRSLPPADRILDLGGTHLGKDVGALVALGYPYRFSELVIIDLPSDERHPLYQAQHVRDRVDSQRGPVQYRYHSMTDLSDYDDESFDLVYSGQTIEHVTEEECDLVLGQVARVLRPGGHLAVDTPNARATRLQQDEFIDPDHKIEYTHAEFTAKLRAAGFDVVDAKGLNYLGDGLAAGRFSIDEAADNQGVYDAIEDCYLLAYVARKR